MKGGRGNGIGAPARECFMMDLEGKGEGGKSSWVAQSAHPLLGIYLRESVVWASFLVHHIQGARKSPSHPNTQEKVEQTDNSRTLLGSRRGRTWGQVLPSGWRDGQANAGATGEPPQGEPARGGNSDLSLTTPPQVKTQFWRGPPSMVRFNGRSLASFP